VGVELRRAQERDREAMASLCARNAARGGEPFRSFPKLAPELYLKPYLELQPAHCWVAVDAEDQLLGYAIGAADTRAHRRAERRFLQRQTPKLLRSLFVEAKPSGTGVRRLLSTAKQLVRHGMTDAGVERHVDLDRFPAHCHLQVRREIAPPTIGLGLLLKLQSSFVEAGARGQHGSVTEPEAAPSYWRLVQTLGGKPVVQHHRKGEDGTPLVSTIFQLPLRQVT